MKHPLAHLGVAVLVLLASGALYAFVHHAVAVRKAKSSETFALMVASEKMLADSEEAAKRLAGVSSIESAVASYLVSSDGVVAFLESLERAGKEFGAAVSVVSVTEALAPRPHLSIALKIDGPFAPVMRTIGIIEYGPHDTQVSSLTLDSDAEARAWHATMTIQVGTASSTRKTP